MVAGYHIGELLFGIVVSAGVGPGDGPVAGDFAPYHYAHPFGLAYHVLIVRVVGQADKVAAQFLRPGEQRARVLHGVRAAAAVGLLLVYGYAFQEDRLIVQQYLLAAGLYGAETNLICYCACVKSKLDIIKFRVLRAPELQVLGLYLKGSADFALRICSQLLLQFQFRNGDFYRVSGFCLVQFSGETDFPVLCLGISLLQLEAIVLQIHRTDLDQHYVTGDSAVVPPVKDLGGHVLRVALVVHLDYDGVLAFAQQVADIQVERGETPDMVSRLPAVHPDMTVGIDRTKVELGAVVGHRHRKETAFEPDRSFVEEKAVVLGIPVRWNLQGGRLVKVVFYKILRPAGLGVPEEPGGSWVHAVVVIAFLLDIHYVVPVTVQGGSFVGLGILKQRQFRLAISIACTQYACQYGNQNLFHIMEISCFTKLRESSCI